MADVAAGVIAAEQVVSTGIEAGAAVAVAQPTQPLNVTLSRLATGPVGDDSLTLARSHHTITTIGNRAYIFGGQTTEGQLCPNDIHAVALGEEAPGEGQFAVYPAMAIRDSVPGPRKRHAACAWGETLVIHGGQDGSNSPVDERSCLWQWDTKTAEWSVLTATGPAPAPRHGHLLLSDEENGFLVLLGGKEDGQPSRRIWLFEFETRTWSELPPPPGLFSAAQYVDGTIYCISDDSRLGGSLFVFKLASPKDESSTAEWATVDFPSNPLAPGPPQRPGSALIPVNTGLGRNYLLYLLGCEQETAPEAEHPAKDAHHNRYQDMWSLQLPSGTFTPSQVKDSIRSALPGTSSGTFTWHQLQMEPDNATRSEALKAQRLGARSFFAADTCKGGKAIVIWGGIGKSGKTEAGGWLLQA